MAKLIPLAKPGAQAAVDKVPRFIVPNLFSSAFFASPTGTLVDGLENRTVAHGISFTPGHRQPARRSSGFRSSESISRRNTTWKS